MTTSKFIFRPSTKSGAHEGSLSLRVICNRIPKTVCIHCRVFPHEWSESTQTLLYPSDDPVRLAYLRDIDEKMRSCTAKLDKIIRQFEASGDPFVTADLIEHFHSASKEKAMTLSDFVAILSAVLIAQQQFRTSDAYLTASRGLIKFNNGEDILLTEINAFLAKQFETDMKERCKALNTISFYMRNLRAIYNKGVDAGHIPHGERPFADVYTGVDDTRKRALNSSEMNRIASIDFKELEQQLEQSPCKQQRLTRLEFAVLIFLFGFYAHGMSFIDICYLKKSNIHGDVIRYYRKKTGKLIEVPMNDEMLKIIRYFEQDTSDSEYLFPILTDKTGNAAVLRRQYESALRVQNLRLKKVAALVKLGKLISTHVARHAWASISKAAMLPISVISEGLGHSSEKMTRKYLASFDNSVLKKAGKAVIEAVSQSTGLSGVTT